jgi:hypothetical protein
MKKMSIAVRMKKDLTWISKSPLLYGEIMAITQLYCFGINLRVNCASTNYYCCLCHWECLHFNRHIECYFETVYCCFLIGLATKYGVMSYTRPHFSWTFLPPQFSNGLIGNRRPLRLMKSHLCVKCLHCISYSALACTIWHLYRQVGQDV